MLLRKLRSLVYHTGRGTSNEASFCSHRNMPSSRITRTRWGSPRSWWRALRGCPTCRTRAGSPIWYVSQTISYLIIYLPFGNFDSVSSYIANFLNLSFNACPLFGRPTKWPPRCSPRRCRTARFPGGCGSSPPSSDCSSSRSSSSASTRYRYRIHIRPTIYYKANAVVFYLMHDV